MRDGGGINLSVQRFLALITTMPDGMSFLIAAGENLESVKPFVVQSGV